MVKKSHTEVQAQLTDDVAGQLLQTAFESGASKATILSASDIVIEESLAALCLEPRCENYGLSKSCPPHVSGPSGFREKLTVCHRALFFKIDVPADILFSSARRDIFQLLHQIASTVERTAVELGYENSEAFAGGSCKNIFCHLLAECNVISGSGSCRHASFARQSMSGFGIHVSKLMEKAGWPLKKATAVKDTATDNMSHICGLVLIY